MSFCLLYVPVFNYFFPCILESARSLGSCILIYVFLFSVFLCFGHILYLSPLIVAYEFAAGVCWSSLSDVHRRIRTHFSLFHISVSKLRDGTSPSTSFFYSFATSSVLVFLLKGYARRFSLRPILFESCVYLSKKFVEMPTTSPNVRVKYVFFSLFLSFLSGLIVAFFLLL